MQNMNVSLCHSTLSNFGYAGCITFLVWFTSSFPPLFAFPSLKTALVEIVKELWRIATFRYHVRHHFTWIVPFTFSYTSAWQAKSEKCMMWVFYWFKCSIFIFGASLIVWQFPWPCAGWLGRQRSTVDQVTGTRKQDSTTINKKLSQRESPKCTIIAANFGS